MPAEPRLAWLPMMVSVALACLDPFFAASLGLMVSVPFFELKIPPPRPKSPEPPVPPLPASPSPPGGTVCAIVAGAARTARTAAADAATPALTAVGLIARKTHRDTSERGGTSVEQSPP